MSSSLNLIGLADDERATFLVVMTSAVWLTYKFAAGLPAGAESGAAKGGNDGGRSNEEPEPERSSFSSLGNTVQENASAAKAGKGGSAKPTHDRLGRKRASQLPGGTTTLGRLLEHHKACWLPAGLLSMWYFDNFGTRPSVVTGLFGAYGIVWVLKSNIYPDLQFYNSEGALIHGKLDYLRVFVLIGIYFIYPVLAAYNPDPEFTAQRGGPGILVAGILFFCTGGFFHWAGDAQRYYQLKHSPGKLITDGFFAHVRHPSYLGELLMWSGLTLLSGPTSPFAWIPVAWLLIVTVVLGVPKKEQSLARYGEEFEQWKAEVPGLVPRLVAAGPGALTATGQMAVHHSKYLLLPSHGSASLRKLGVLADLGVLFLTFFYVFLVFLDGVPSRGWLSEGFCVWRAEQNARLDSHSLSFAMDLVAGSVMTRIAWRRYRFALEIGEQKWSINLLLAAAFCAFVIAHGFAHLYLHFYFLDNGFADPRGADFGRTWPPSAAFLLAFAGKSAFLLICPAIGMHLGMPPHVALPLHFLQCYVFLVFVPMRFIFGGVLGAVNLWYCVSRLVFDRERDTRPDSLARASILNFLSTPVPFAEMLGCDAWFGAIGGHIWYDFAILVMTALYAESVWREGPAGRLRGAAEPEVQEKLRTSRGLAMMKGTSRQRSLRPSKGENCLDIETCPPETE